MALSGLIQIYFWRPFYKFKFASPLGQSDAPSGWYSGGRGFDPRVQHHLSLGFSQEIISTAILSLPLIQVGQLSVTGESMGT